MTDNQNYALQKLYAIIPSRLRSRIMLPLPHGDKPADTSRIEEWEGWCEGWAFQPGKVFAEALDVRVTQRSEFITDENGQKIPRLDEYGVQMKDEKGKGLFQRRLWQEWSQGNKFSFAQGDTIYSAPCPAWPPAKGVKLIRVRDAKPVTADGPREAATVTLELYESDGQTIGEPTIIRTTQDGLVRMLITGNPPATGGKA